MLQTLDPQKITGWLLLGSARSRVGDNQGALAAYNAALAIDNGNIAALVNGGTCLRDLGQPEAALSRLLQASRLAPHVPEAIYNVGDIYLALERFGAAENAASAAIKLSPSMSAAHVLRIISLEGALQYDEALRAAQLGVFQNPSHYGLHYERARMLRLVGKLADAEAAFKKCTSPSFYHKAEGVRSSSVAYAHNEYAALLSQLGRNEDARKHWRRTVEVDPSFAQGWVNAASHEDGLEQSLAMYQRAAALSPGLAEAWINIGQVYYNSFRQDASYMRRALEAFERALAVAPQASSALYSVARSRVDLCHWGGRDALFEEVARRMRRDLERGSLLSTSLSLVHDT